MRLLIAFLSIFFFAATLNAQSSVLNTFPDGSAVSPWFLNSTKIQLKSLGKRFTITKFGVKKDSTLVQTKAIQHIIDDAAAQGGGVIVIPKGTFLSGALFFKPKTHLYVSKDAVLKGSDNINDYPMMASRIEGQSIDYFPALVNAYGVDGFTISGFGMLDGNGLKYWEAFWQRRKENPQCTNLEVSRPRLVFIWNCKDVQVQDVKLHDSGFWTSHYYKCTNVKILNLHIVSPHAPVKAPSTDAIDIDACTNVLIKGCYMAVNDDATLTCGSEAIHNKNIVVRNCHVNEAMRVLWLKMRPDTPQMYEYITVQNISGTAHSLIYVKPWTQFFDLKGRKDSPLSYCDHIVLKDINMKCAVFYDIAINEYNKLSDFTFENLAIKAGNAQYDKSIVKGIVFKNVVVNDEVIE